MPWGSTQRLTRVPATQHHAIQHHLSHNHHMTLRHHVKCTLNTNPAEADTERSQAHKDDNKFITSRKGTHNTTHHFGVYANFPCWPLKKLVYIAAQLEPGVPVVVQQVMLQQHLPSCSASYIRLAISCSTLSAVVSAAPYAALTPAHG